VVYDVEPPSESVRDVVDEARRMVEKDPEPSYCCGLYS
jgi:hypothetical protein